MDEIKVNEEMTKMAIMAHDVAKLKQDEAMMRKMINDVNRKVESDMEGRDQLTAMLCKSAIEAVLNRIYDDPFAMVEIEQMVQEIDHMQKDKES